MNSKDSSHTIFRDLEFNGGIAASKRRASYLWTGADDDHTERFEVLLRLMLVVCVGAAMLACGAGTPASASLADRAPQDAPDVAQAAAASVPTMVARKM